MRDRSFFVVAACFFLSGFAALIYETAWTREFSFVFGTSELAIATVLAAYMAGLAGGAAVGGHLAPRLRRPLFAYALLEAGIGVAALLVPAAIAGATALLEALFGGQASFDSADAANGLAISIFYLIATFVIVLIPTGFMGATLPLLSRHAVRTDSEIGPRVGALYSLNTLGAVMGTLAAGFVLLPWLGIRSTVGVGVAINGLVFLIAMTLVRQLRPSVESRSEPRTASRSELRRWHVVLPLILVSGALSFVYEVLWARLLSQVLGGSIYAFTTMLASFLAGIAIGSAGASRLARSSERALALFAWAEVGVAVLTATSFWLVDSARGVIQWLGSDNHLAVDVSLSMIVLLPAAICIGATFPLAVRVLARGAEDAGPASARVYSWNTIGAIAGSIGAAFWLLPALGFRGTILLGVIANLMIAAVALAVGSNRRAALVPVVVASLLAFVLPGEPWQILRSSPLDLAAPPMPGEIGFYAVGRGATVMMTKETPVSWRLSTNGLPESLIATSADISGRSQTAVMLGAIGAILRPDARSMLLVGLGGGVSLERVPRNIERIDVIELEQEVLAANRWLDARRDIDPLVDPRVHVHINDARSALLLNDEKFDVIAAQASHPWTGGSANLYSGEFFELVAKHLEKDGVFVQWVGRDFIDVDLFKAIVRTLYDEFEYVQVYRELLFVASNSPLPDVVDFDVLRASDPEISRRLGIYTPEDFAVLMRMDAAATRRFAEGAQRIDDDRNLLQMRSAEIVRSTAEEQAAVLQEMFKVFEEFDPLPRLAASHSLDGVALVARLKSGQGPRSRWLAEQLEDPQDRGRLRALGMAGATGRFAIDSYLEAHPEDAEVRARALLLDISTRRLGEQGSRWAYESDLSDAERILIEVDAVRRRGDWDALAEMDSRLASIAPGTPLFRYATTVRISWRIQSGDPRHAREAIDLIDDLYRTAHSNQLLFQRARAASLLGDVHTEVASLAAVKLVGVPAAIERWRSERDAMLNRIPLEGELAEWRDQLLAMPVQKGTESRRPGIRPRAAP